MLLAEGRKFGLRMVLANQYLALLRQAKVGERLIQGLFGNVGTLVAFRVGYEDAKTLCAELGPPILPPDLSTLPNYRALLRMMGPAGPQVPTLDPEP